jgi:kynureninase
VIAAAVLRQLHAVIVIDDTRNPAIARHGTRPKTLLHLAA